MSIKNLVLAICTVFFIGNALFAQTPTSKYVGADKCKMCHNSPAKGEQYNKWTESLHSKAMAALTSDAALKYAKDNNIADPSKEAKCLKCHSTYDGVADKTTIATLTEAEGVSCESCHGAGSAYKTMNVMKDLTQAKANGLVIPDETVCKKCHTPEGNPFYKPFDYATYWPKISHMIPK